jgi:hypothetical protein
MNILFVVGFGPITTDTNESRNFYEGALGIAFEGTADGYLHTQALDGVKHFALWPLSQAAESCLGSDRWPETVKSPQAWIEFEVASVEEATDELVDRGYELLVRMRTEPWGQTVSRLLSPEGLLVGVVRTPAMH